MSDEETSTPNVKGRPTPSRKEAEAARKARMKKPVTRKEQLMRDRKVREEYRAKQREALRTGKGTHLPPRDRGPVRAFVRDYVDRRHNFAEYLLPFLVVTLIVSLLQQASALAVALTFALYTFGFTGTLLDEIFLVRRLKKELRARFPDENLSGTSSYAVLRSTQLRRFRLPKVAIGRGEPLRDHYT